MSTYGRQQGSGCACAVQTTAPMEKGTTHWSLSSIPWHHPLVASTPQQGGSECFWLSSKLQARNQTRDAASPPAAPGLGSASPPRGQAHCCAEFYFRLTFECIQARLAKVHSASLSHVQYFHSRIKSLVVVTGINTLASCDFSVRHLQFSRWHQVKLSA